MLFLKAVTTDENKVEYFNTQNIISMQPQGKNLKILMGAGLFWRVKADTVELVELKDIFNKE